MTPRAASYDVFGAKLTPLTLDEILSALRAHVSAREPCIVAYQNLHGLYVRLRDPIVDVLHRHPLTYVHIDGMPLIALCRLCGIPAQRRHRITLVDSIWPVLMLAASQGWRVYFVGGTPAIVEAGANAIRARLPSLDFRGHHGYLDTAGTHEVLQDVRAFTPHLVIVGMGMGAQERWVAQNLEGLAPASVCLVGACMEYLAGAVRTPPRWMGQNGCEWLFRLGENPRRFWRRYLIEPWFVLAHILSHRGGVT